MYRDTLNVWLLWTVVLGSLWCTGAIAGDAGKAELALTERIVAHDKDFTVCARLSNRGTRRTAVTAPFTFVGALQVFAIIDDLQGRNTNKPGFIPSMPSPPNADDRLSYALLNPGDGLETCHSWTYDKFDVEAVKVTIAFDSWYQGWQKLPFDDFERSMMYDMPIANQHLETSCKVDLKKKTSACPTYPD